MSTWGADIPPKEFSVRGFMRKKLTATVIDKLVCPESKSQIKLFDAEVSGFGVRVTSRGVKTFIFERRPKGTGRLRQEKIGRCSDLSAEQARRIARKKAIAYEDPEYIQKQAAAKARLHFNEAFEQYASIRMKSFADSTRVKQLGLFTREVLPRTVGLLLENFNRVNLSGITLPIQKSGREGTASDVWKAVSAFLTWCVRQGYIQVNPVLGATPEFKVNSKDRVLSLPELVAIWHAVESLSPVRCSAVRILSLMPFRKSEFTACRWEELSNECLTIPAERSKNRRPISLLMTSFTRLQLPNHRNDTDLMFSTNGVVPTRLDDKLLKRVSALSGVDSFSWHDFRRTFSTHLQETDNADFIAIDACLNHTTEAQRGVAGVYNRANYNERMKVVMQQWSDIVEAAIG